MGKTFLAIWIGSTVAMAALIGFGVGVYHAAQAMGWNGGLTIYCVFAWLFVSGVVALRLAMDVEEDRRWRK